MSEDALLQVDIGQTLPQVVARLPQLYQWAVGYQLQQWQNPRLVMIGLAASITDELFRERPQVPPPAILVQSMFDMLRQGRGTSESAVVFKTRLTKWIAIHRALYTHDVRGTCPPHGPHYAGAHILPGAAAGAYRPVLRDVECLDCGAVQCVAMQDDGSFYSIGRLPMGVWGGQERCWPCAVDAGLA